MALVNCPECGKTISDTAPHCPHCGYKSPMAKSECPQCHAPVDGDSLFCESCGFRLRQPVATPESSIGRPAAPKKRSLTWLWITLSALIVVAGGIFVAVTLLNSREAIEIPVVTEEDRVTEAAETYIDAINRKDAETAKAYSTEDTKDVVDAILTFASDQFESYTRISYVNIYGESATAKVIRTGEKPLDMNLRKVDGEWKVEAAKETGNV